MKSTALKIAFYGVLAIGAALIAFSLHSIAQTEYMIGSTLADLISAAPRAGGKQPLAGDFVSLAQNGSTAFSDYRLVGPIPRTEGSFIFNESKSNSGSAIAYAELTDCAGVTHDFEISRKAPECAWTYSIKVYYPKNDSVITVRTVSGSASDLADKAVIDLPIAWSKNDKALILSAWDIGAGKNNFETPSAYSSLSLANGQLSPLGDDTAFFLDEFSRAIVVESSAKRPLCPSQSGNFGRISMMDVETGKSTPIAEDPGTAYRLSSLDRRGGRLTYRYQSGDSQELCGFVNPDKLPEKTVPVKL